MTPTDEGIVQEAEAAIEKVGEEVVQEAEKIIGDVASALAPIAETLFAQGAQDLIAANGDTAKLGELLGQQATAALAQAETASLNVSVGDALSALGAAAKSFESANAPIPATPTAVTAAAPPA